MRIIHGLIILLSLALAACGMQPPAAEQPPTPLPAPPPYPTMEPRRWLGGSDPQAVFQLPGTTFDLHLAVHPTQGWPAVAIVQRFSESREPIQAFVRVLNPRTRVWSAAQQVDIGASSNGMDRFGSALVGITGDGQVHAVWGSSDAEGGLWTSTSADYGASWSPPRRLLTNCWAALDMATTPSGQIVILASCYTTPDRPHTTVLIRDGGGTWLPPQTVALEAWSGAIAVAGDRQDLRMTALIMPLNAADRSTGYLLGKYLADPGPWQVRPLRLSTTGAGDADTVRIRARHLSFTRPLPNNQVSTGLSFTWSEAERAHAYAITSLDGGLSFGPATPIAIDDSLAGTGAGAPAVFAAPAYDPVADRLAAIWICCRDATSARVPATHYASWSEPGRTSWSPAPGAARTPTIIGSRSSHHLASAQAPMSRWVWLAWVEGANEITVRSYDLNKIIPVEQYPTATPAQ